MPMVTYLFYTKGSQHERAVESFKRELDRNGVENEQIDADSPRGVTLTANYDIMERPAVVITGPDGTPLERWEGQLPLASDVSYLTHR